jgi:hypothetical protein
MSRCFLRSGCPWWLTSSRSPAPGCSATRCLGTVGTHGWGRLADMLWSFGDADEGLGLSGGVGGGSVPFHEQDGGVVAQGALMVFEDAVDQPPQCFGDGQGVGVVAQQEIEEAAEAEFLSGGVAGFGDAVGVKDDAVAGFGCRGWPGSR